MVKDSSGFLWLGTPEGLYRYDGFEFSLINTFLIDGLRLSDPQVNSLMLDSLHNLWVATDNGVTILNTFRNDYIHFAVASDNIENEKNSLLFVVQNNEFVWLGGNQGILYRVSLASVEDAFKYKQPLDFIKKALPGKIPIFNMAPAKEGGVWVNNRYVIMKINKNMVHQMEVPIAISISSFRFTPDEKAFYAPSISGILTYDVTTESTELLHDFKLPRHIQESYRERHIETDPQGGWWIYGSGGVFGKFDSNTKSYIDFSPAFRKLNINEYGSFQALLQDQPNHLWIGMSDGLYEVNLHEKLFQKLMIPSTENPVDAFIPRSFYALKDSSVLIGGYSAMYRYFPKLNKFKRIDIFLQGTEEGLNPLAYDFFEQGDTVYIASETFGLLFFDPLLDTISALMTQHEYEGLGPERRIVQWSTSVLKDHKNVIWLGTYEGIMFTNLKDTLSTFRMNGQKVLSRTFISDIQEDKNHTIWVATSNGLYSIPPNRDKLIGHSVSEFAQISIKALYLNSDGTIWLATNGEGLKLYDPISKKVQTYTISNGLPDNVVVSIYPDSKGNFWLGTNYGLCYFSPGENSFYNFFLDDGLPGNTFQHNALAKDLSGNIYAGLLNGIALINTARISSYSVIKMPVIAKIIKYNGAEKVTYTSIYSSFKEKSINLDYRDSYFSIYFSIKEFTGQKPQFSYQLEGVSQEWTFLGEQNNLQFAALPPGNYNLKIKGRSGKSGWSDSFIIPINVNPAFYKTWWAYLAYIIFFGGVIYIGLRLFWNRLQLQRQWQLEHSHNLQLEQLAEAKTRFFTNITHELRTPLTLIKGPISKISQQSTDKKIQKLAGLADKQANAMLHLVDQMLELNRIESGTEKLLVVKADVVNALKLISEAFQPLAIEKNINMKLLPDVPFFQIDFDPDKFQKIIHNLLSNAFKFTPAGGSILVNVITNAPTYQDQIYISIEDTGIGISSEALPFIFDRFFQADSSLTRSHGGTGIGLSYVKELILLHKGKIEVKSTPGEGSIFQLILPVEQPEAIRMFSKSELPVKTPDSQEFYLPKNNLSEFPLKASSATLPSVLLIEDHQELAEFIIECLAAQYQVQWARNGAEGYQKAIRNVPDLIISDLMMPKMDGLTLARQLKAHELTSHIPLVILTARSTEQERMKGLKGGADAYLTKPFSVEELTLTLKNLLQLRNKIAERFIQVWQLGADKELPARLGNSSFFERFTKIVESNISDENFGVNELLKEIGMSRTQLHRKLKATTGQSANELLRNIKMQKALLLLKNLDLPVAEVASQVGYGSPSYFSKIFGEHFGFLPKAVREKSVSNN